MFQTRRGLSLLRIAPLVSWSLGALAIALGFAVHKRHSMTVVDWSMALIVLVSAVLLQAVIVRREYSAVSGAAVGKKRKATSANQRLFWLGILGSLAAVLLGVYIARTT